MTTSNSNSTIATAAKAAKSLTPIAVATAKSSRVLETREAWQVVYDHLVELVTLTLKGEELPEKPLKGFAFKKATEQPHIKGYALSLLSGFTTKKAAKAIPTSSAIALDSVSRLQVSTKLAETLKLGNLSKAEPKQAVAFTTSVVNSLGMDAEGAKAEYLAAKAAKKAAKAERLSAKAENK